LKGAYPERMTALVEGIRSEFGFMERDLETAAAPLEENSQLRLF
jgi:hypothetical protein